ncbi:MAG: hypothetical protein JNM09_01725 [Blastocatellia bacterium]|nr:hypothetical protein [Blastocatellia bacterium]
MKANSFPFTLPEYSDEDLDALLANVQPVLPVLRASVPAADEFFLFLELDDEVTIEWNQPIAQESKSTRTLLKAVPDQMTTQHLSSETLLLPAQNSTPKSPRTVQPTQQNVVPFPTKRTATETDERHSVPAISPTKIPATPIASRVELPSAWSNELRALSSTILVAAKTQNQRSFLVCDVTPGAGANVICRGLSQLLASAWKLDVLYCGLGSQGISAEGTAPSKSNTAIERQEPLYLRLTGQPNLQEMTTSHGDLALADLLIRYDLQTLVSQLKQEFDLLFFEAPPLSSHHEVDLLAAQVDSVILVVRPGVTSKAEVQKVQARLERVKANILGVVFHQPTKKWPRLF